MLEFLSQLLLALLFVPNLGLELRFGHPELSQMEDLLPDPMPDQAHDHQNGQNASQQKPPLCFPALSAHCAPFRDFVLLATNYTNFREQNLCNS